MFGLLVEYSSLAVAGAVQRAFEAGCLCVYVVRTRTRSIVYIHQSPCMPRATV